MNKWFFVSGLLFSVCTHAASVTFSEKTKELSVVINNHQQAREIYINGVSRVLDADTGLFVSCFEQELTELQIDEKLYPVACGVNVNIQLAVQEGAI